MANVHFGVTIPQIKRTWEESRDASREFEAMGFDSLWVCDHLYGPQSPQIPILEAWSLISAVAAVTSKVEIGTLVTPAGMRNAPQLGKVIATIDNIAEGRIIPGLGAGWMPREFSDFGVPFLPTSQRLIQLRETVEVLKRMWTEPSVSYDGKDVKATTLVCEPKPVRVPPILIGGQAWRPPSAAPTEKAGAETPAAKEAAPKKPAGKKKPATKKVVAKKKVAAKAGGKAKARTGRRK
jgi:alkanesulfonate monooxygenase SsuD/methylene tetrahydromethanopterin reductase-like flavin-dependent oxidoreductase (luciferase family)